MNISKESTDSYTGKGNDGDNNDNGVPDSAEIFDRSQQRNELFLENQQKRDERNQADRHKRADLALKAEEIKQKERDSRQKAVIEANKQRAEDRRQSADLKQRARRDGLE